ncbi:MAG TPA: hypothetical protein VFQ05_03060, partial [Candidatus Eisenbacteria bacterium]|nr:hypothetical protein [Candidatus Eisenbacteria bacterium]
MQRLVTVLRAGAQTIEGLGAQRFGASLNGRERRSLTREGRKAGFDSHHQPGDPAAPDLSRRTGAGHGHPPLEPLELDDPDLADGEGFLGEELGELLGERLTLS